MHHLADKSEEEVKKLVLKRETVGNVGPLHRVVFAMLINPAKKDKDYLIIFKKLISLGADVNGKSAMGNTSLHWLAAPITSDVECAVKICLAEKLMENGADVHLKNRFGQTALYSASVCTSPVTLEVVKLLLVHGRDPDILDNKGTSVRMGASAALLKLIGTHHDTKKSKAVRQKLTTSI